MAGSPQKRARREAGEGKPPANPGGALNRTTAEEVLDEELEVEGTGQTGDVRSFLRGTIDERMDFLAEQLLRSAQATKNYRFTCPHCGRNCEASIPDHKQSTDAIDKLIAMGYGRKTSDTTKSQGFVLERRIVRPSEEEVLDEETGE